MKKIFSLIAIMLFGITAMLGQAPGILNYQGVARNSVGNVLANKNITLRLTIHDGSAAGATVYQESRNVTTNPFGLFNVQLGSAGFLTQTGTIAGVPWGVGLKFIQVEIDPNGGSSFINIGTAQLASVPYSLYANLAGDLVLPFNKTQADAGTLFKITNSGTGSGSTALEGLTNSTAANAFAIIGTVTNTSPGGFSTGVRGINNGTGGLGIGVWGSQNGSGWGVYGQTPSGLGVYGNTNTGTGVYGNAGAGGIGVYGISSTGNAGRFEITNSANNTDALAASTNGGAASWAIRATSTGAQGAGIFQYSNGSGAANALRVLTNGTGFAANITSSNATPQALRTQGGLQFTGINEALNRILSSDAAGNALWKDPGAIGIVTGNGTVDRVPKWTPVGTNLGDSRIEDKTAVAPIGINTPNGYVYTSAQPGLEMTNSAALLQTRIVLRDQSDGGDVIGFVDGRTSPTTALSALQVGTLSNHPITFFANGTFIGRWSTAGNLGIGTAAGVDATTRLQIDNATTGTGSILVNQTGATNTVRAASLFNSNTTATTYGNGTLYAQRGTNSLANTYLYTGIATSISGVAASTTGFGVQGTSETGYGVAGLSTTGVAVHGINITSGNAGLFANNSTANAAPVVAVNDVSTVANSFGVHSTVTSTTPGGFSAALRGQNNGTGGLGIGVWGSQAGGGWGVYGTAISGLGVYGTSTSGFGVYGQASSGIGVYGISTTGESGHFDNTNSSNTSHTVNIQTNGSGRGLNVAATGTSGNAARVLLGTAPATAIATAATIYGESNTSIGVVGVSGSQNGVYGLSTGTLGGTVGVNTGTGNGIWGVSTTNGRAGYFETNPANAKDAVGISQTGIGQGLDVSLPNVANGSRGINVSVAGTGSGVFAETQSGFAGVEGRTNTITGAGIIGRNQANGEAIVGFTAGGVGVGAVVGRNDGGGYGVRGFTATVNGGIGVIGQSGISGTTGIAGRFENVNSANAGNTLEVATNGIGQGMDVNISNAGNGSRGINVSHAGIGSAIFAETQGGFAGVEGRTNTISGAGIIGRNQANGEAIVGFTAGGVGVGAVVGRNDGGGYGVRGFTAVVNGGIGVIGQAGISGTTGIAGRFENVNAANSGHALEAASNGSGAPLFVNNTNAGATDLAIFQKSSANVARIDGTGKGFFNNGTQVGGADVAEYFEVEGARNEYEAGDVLVISQSSDRKVEKSSAPYSTLVSGVYATKPGVMLTERNAAADQLDDMVPMGVIGVIPTKVCMEGGAIKRGDLLVTSSIPGVAMKADPEKVKVGQVIGKALQDYDSNTTGKINVLVSIK